MNYYPHHIGDFNNATRHLTRVERSLYRDAIELYYDTEHPLPGDDFDRLAKRLLAISDEEKGALMGVLNEFFTLDSGFYHHARCDAEIAKYRASAASKSKAGKASAAKRQHNSTRVEQVLNECATNQEPRTKNQEPVVKQAPRKRAAQLPDDFYPNDKGLESAAVKGIDVQAELEKFRNYHQSKASLMVDWQAAWRTWVGNARQSLSPSQPVKVGSEQYLEANKNAAWVKAAGFDSVWDAANAKCWHHNAHEFRDGHRIAEAA